MDTPMYDGDWTPELAEELARAEGVELGEREWCAIAGIRELLARGGDPGELMTRFAGTGDEALLRFAGAPELERRR